MCIEIIGSNFDWYYLVTEWEPEDIRRVTEVPVVPVGRRSLFFRIVFPHPPVLMTYGQTDYVLRPLRSLEFIYLNFNIFAG